MDLEDEEENKDDVKDKQNNPPPQQKPISQTSQQQHKPQPIPSSQPQVNKKELMAAIQNKKQTQPPFQKTINPKDDIYPEKPEGKYHSVDKMTSLGVLTEEK